ncbi:Serine/threonine-protein kinase PrkC [Anatilimnocola aggregata]|uniref:Serine/threonine-protein kinase PrkC n=1 Tax=Anatilimnocola aggregata TaxID=2528021 RepID=A0A517YDJ8_9BACT|nr:Serine/threonine-protein kinase PrkC [Anatilimnocola aggregata]
MDALVAYDEQLRQGIEIVATGSTDGSDALLPEELTDCLRRLEQVWPRSKPSSSKESLPSAIGRFEIERQLGHGGFGIVYLARDPLLRRKVALKVPRLHVLANESLRERFRREGRATANLDHPNIVPIHELGEGDSVCYIAFAYCEGPSLGEWLKTRSTRVPLETAARIVQQLAEAMHYSHVRGVLHRDLKPNNVLLFPAKAPVGDATALGFVPRIVDFGLARLAEEDLEATGTSGVVGTPLYMAPEQALGDPENVGPAADVYSLGTILYELLSGHPPFQGIAPLEVLDRVRNAEPPSLRTERSDVPRDLETICLHCLEKRPEERYASAEELAEDLRRFIAGSEVRAQPISIWQRALRVCQQPQRIREAGLTVIGTHAAVIASMVMTLYMVQAGNVVQRPDSFSLYSWAPQACLFMFTGHVPMIFIGWMLMRQRLWAAWVSLIAGAAMVFLSLLFIVGFVPAGMTSWDDIPGFRIVYPMMAMVFVLQTAMSTIAVIALKRLRRR